MADGKVNGDATADDDVPPGQRVEVRNRFDGSWSGGFEVTERVDDGYRVRRRSDGAILPGVFRVDEVRREGRRGRWPT